MLIPKYAKEWDPIELFQAMKAEVEFLEKFPALESGNARRHSRPVACG